MLRVTNILYTQRLWCENKHAKLVVTRSTSSQPTYAATTSQLPQGWLAFRLGFLFLLMYINVFI